MDTDTILALSFFAGVLFVIWLIEGGRDGVK